jgi:hypothetical protein
LLAGCSINYTHVHTFAGDQGSQLAKADEELRRLREQIAALE